MDQRFEGLRIQNQLCFPLYAAAREVIKRYRPFLDPLDLTYTQYIALMVLWEEKKLSVKELGSRLFLDSGTLTPVLKNLEIKGYVCRTRSKQDERVLEVTVTEKGEALKEQAASIPQQMASCVKLDAEEAAALHQLLYKVLDGLQE